MAKNLVIPIMVYQHNIASPLPRQKVFLFQRCDTLFSAVEKASAYDHGHVGKAPLNRNDLVHFDKAGHY